MKEARADCVSDIAPATLSDETEHQMSGVWRRIVADSYTLGVPRGLVSLVRKQH